MARTDSTTIEVSSASGASIAEYACVPTAFCVNTVLDVEDTVEGGLLLAEHQLGTPYVKDYDGHAEGPAQWGTRFDTSRWRLLIARRGDTCVGGAAVACGLLDLEMSEGRSDLAVLWDVRVLPAARRQGIGAALFRAAEAWALGRGCRELKVETQNINAAACAFYAQRGCVLRAAHHGIYEASPDEVQLLWYKTLSR